MTSSLFFQDLFFPQVIWTSKPFRHWHIRLTVATPCPPSAISLYHTVAWFRWQEVDGSFRSRHWVALTFWADALSNPPCTLVPLGFLLGFETVTLLHWWHLWTHSCLFANSFAQEATCCLCPWQTAPVVPSTAMEGPQRGVGSGPVFASGFRSMLPHRI